MIFSNRVTDITYQQILPSLVDQVNNSNVFTARVLNSPKSWSGTRIDKPMQIANSSTGQSFDGMDTFSTATTNNTRTGSWYVKGFEQSVVIPGIERDVNGNSEKQVLSLLAAKLDEAKNSAANTVGTLLYGLGLNKDFDGLGLIVDDGTDTSSYAGLTRSSNTFINGNVTAASGGALTLDLVSQEFDDASAASSDSESPDIAITTKTVWTLFESLLAPTVQSFYTATQINGYNKVSGGTPSGVSVPAAELKGAAGFNAISYRGRPVVADDKATSGVFFWINETYLSFHALKSLESNVKSIESTNKVTEGFYKDVPMPSAFQFRELMDPVNQYGQIGFLLLMGNLIHTAPRRNGKITGVTTV